MTTAASPLPVAVVIVAWNSAVVLGDCLVAVLREQPAEVVVVDNASTDGTLSRWRPVFPQVRWIGAASNLGFAAGSNLGVACSTAPFVLFLNDDARLRPGYLRTLMQALASRPDAASAVGKLIATGAQGDTIDSAGIDLCAYALRPSDRGNGERDIGQYDQPAEIFGPTGAAALYRRSAFAGQDPFDASLFAYYEDVDLAWRLGDAGWRHLYVPSAVAEHDRRGPRAKPLPIAARAFINRYRVWRKNETLRRFAVYAPVAVPWEIARLIRLALTQPRLARAVLATLTRASSGL